MVVDSEHLPLQTSIIRLPERLARTITTNDK